MKGRREAALGFSDVCAKLRVTRLRHDRRYLSNTVCSLNVLPRNESAYDVDARRKRRPNRVSAPEAAGLEGPFRVNPHEWGLFNLGLCRHLRPARKITPLLDSR
jgi:hypothetical protein